MIIDFFEQPKLLIGNAREHLQRLNDEGKAFFDRTPHTVVTDTDAKTNEKIYKARLTFRLPGKLPVFLFDVFSNLRSALDYAVCASMLSLFGQSVSLRNVYFPFGNSAEELENSIRGRCKNVPAEIVALMRSFKPYKGGNNLLWALSRFSATNRHQRLIAVGASTNSMFIHEMHAGRDAISVPDPAIWDSVKNELIFARVAPDAELKYDIELSLYIAFGDIEIVRAQPIIPTLDNLARMVSSIVLAMEAETARILPVPAP